MTVRVGATVYLDPEKPAPCELCGTIAELRPYGPNGEKICFNCGNKHPEAVERGITKLHEGATRCVDLRTGRQMVLSPKD